MFDYGKMKTAERPFITKADIILLTVILAAAVGLLFFFQINRVPGSHAILSYDGRTLLQIPLSETRPRYYLVLWDAVSGDGPVSSGRRVSSDVLSSFHIEGLSEAPTVKTLSQDTWEEDAEALLAESGTDYNLFSCENGEIRMLESSCPDLRCVHHAAVSETGENIICLPHRLVIEIAGTQKNELDGVVY